MVLLFEGRLSTGGTFNVRTLRKLGFNWPRRHGLNEMECGSSFFPHVPGTIFLSGLSRPLSALTQWCFHALMPFLFTGRRFILIPFCNASPGTGRKSFPGQKKKRDLKLGGMIQHCRTCIIIFPFAHPQTPQHRHTCNKTRSVPSRRRRCHNNNIVSYTLFRLLHLILRFHALTQVEKYNLFEYFQSTSFN